MRPLCRLIAIVVALVCSAPAGAQGPKKPLDHDAYDLWNTISGQRISDDGKWVLYTLRPGDPDGDATLVVREVASEREYRAARATSARFSPSGRYAVYLVEPDPDVVKQERKEKVPAERQSKRALEILDLASGQTERIERVKGFAMPEEGADLLACHLEAPIPEEQQEDAKPDEPASPEGGEPEPNAPQPAAEPPPDQPERPTGRGGSRGSGPKEDEGTALVLRRLGTSAEHRFERVLSYEIARDGSLLALTTAGRGEEEPTAVRVVETDTGTARIISQGPGHFKSLVFDRAGRRLAFLTDRDDAQAKEPAWSVYLWERGDESARPAASAGMAGVPEGWEIADSSAPSFSWSGARLFFSARPARPKAEEKPESDADEEPQVKVDIWHWRDRQLQPQQLRQASRERSRTYRAVVHPDGAVVQLETPEVRSVRVGSRGDAGVGIATEDLPYQLMDSWESPGFADVYLVDVRTGQRTRILERIRGGASLSPGARYVTWFDYDAQHWRARSVETGETVALTDRIGVPMHDELDDTPAPPRPYGIAGWTPDDRAVLIYDRYDVWAVDPTGFWPPRCVTEGVGRSAGVRLRIVRVDREEETIDPEAPLLLSAFDERTKASGWYRDRVRGTAEPERLVMLDRRVGTPAKAEDADVYLFTRESFRESENLWVSGPAFADAVRVSDANPQQREYLWGDAELYEWTSLTGERLQGILYKPDGFDPTRRYPMLVYFYERSSDGLHTYHPPAPSSSSINRSFYVSRGYLVFVPDIPYRVGFPGQSCLAAVVSGVSALIDEGFVDAGRIGVQGHSWGGYQVAYLVTRTDIFRAAEAGAPVSNMTSAYGGIRWGTGISRMFQYERTQSRIGDSLWRALPRYLENSPVFYADQVRTPLLILHNDNDGAVPWYQGIELFVALRRLGRPCWMFNYNGEDHGLRQRHNREDWSIRMQQFFDHYLKDAPPPVWLAEGVPAVEKGENLGLDLIESWTSDRPRVGDEALGR